MSTKTTEHWAQTLESLFPAGVHAVVADERMEMEPLMLAEQPCIAGAMERRRRDFTLGRACARTALERLGIRAFAILTGPDRAPVWPMGITGSITHCDGFTGAVAAKEGAILGLGLDAEPATPLPPDLVTRVCTEAELAWTAEEPSPMPADWPKVIFSAKEAVYKCLYPATGLQLDFRDVELYISAEDGRFAARPATGRAAHRSLFRQLRGTFYILDNHVVTAATLLTAAD